MSLLKGQNDFFLNQDILKAIISRTFKLGQLIVDDE